MNLSDFVTRMPKVELHLHIEGSLEPELVFEIANRNGVSLPYPDVTSLRQAYEFSDLQSFLDVYYLAAQVLVKEQDFYDMTYAYFTRAAADQVRHCEIFFDPQTHTSRGVSFETVIAGIHHACVDAKAQLGVSSCLIMCFLRHLSEDAAFETLEAALPFQSMIAGVGLDSGEQGNPPSKFVRVFEAAGKQGFRRVAHAGEEGPAANVTDALDLLKVERVDHGVRATEDELLLERLANERIPLTVCPLSNIKLCVYDQMADHPILDMLERGICVTVNSDDPAYFGGYMNANYLSLLEGLGATRTQVLALAKNGIEAAWLDVSAREALLSELEAYAAS